MAGITLAQAEARLAAYLAAEEAVLANQSHTIGDRTYTRADLAQIQDGINVWDARVKQLSASASGRGRARTVRPWG